MAKVAPIQTNTNAGELSPLLYGRPDLDKYQNGLKVCLNSIPQVQGGWTRRPGFRFAAEVKNSARATRVVRFEYSVTQAYIIEIGHLYMRFYRNNAPILEPTKAITDVTQANPVVITAVGHGYSNGDDVELAGIGGTTELNGRRVRVTNATANTFEIYTLQGAAINGAAFTPYTSGGTAARVYTVTTLYSSDDIFQLKFCQKKDVMWITHRAYPPRKLIRLAHDNWQWNGIDFLTGPYLDQNTTGTTLTPGATTGSGISLVASAVTGINGDTGFQTTDVNRLVRILHGSTWGWAKITAWVSTTQVTIAIVSDFGAATGVTTWRLGLWSDTDGWPTCASFWEGRLAYAGAPALPERVTLSMTGQYDIFRPTEANGTVLDNNAVDVDLDSNDVQAIRSMVPDEKGLLVFAVNGEFVVRSATTGEPLTPTNRKSVPSTDKGNADIQAIRAGKAVVTVDRTARCLHEVAYVYTDDGFRAPDMTILAEHISKGGLVELAYQKRPQPVIWAPRDDGILVGMTYSREQNVIGWHRHRVESGVDILAAGAPAASIESVACCPSSDQGSYDLWAVIRRPNLGFGAPKRYIEFMAQPYETGDDIIDAVYVDSAVKTVGSHSQITGLWHLVSRAVMGHYDGKVFGPVVVPETGILTLPGMAQSGSVVGVPYFSDVQQLRNNAGAADGTAQGKTQRTHRMALRLHDTGHLEMGKDFDTLDTMYDAGEAYGAEDIVFRTSDDAAGVATPLFSGDITRPWEGDYTTDNTPCFRAWKPLPATILAIMPQQVTQDR